VAAGPADDRSLPARLAQRIRRTGPIPVSDFVEAALYDPTDGFYMSGGRAGRGGDFLTAPEVGLLFGAVIARAIDGWWKESGSPDPFVVVDMGAGPGTLARSVLAAEPAALRAGALRWAAVDLSSTQRALHPEADVVTSLDRPPTLAGPAVVLANELLDNLPFDVVERTVNGWREVLIGLRGRDEFETTPGEEIEPWSTSFDPPVGTRIPVEARARRFIADMHDLVPEGRLVVLDYGAHTETLARRPDMGWLRVHRRHDDRSSWLTDPGTRDITVDVALDQISADHPASRVVTQAEFLRHHGIEELVEDGRRLWRERAHVGDLDALKARSRVAEAEALTDPAGMGAFFVAEWII
jgi:SAM-dependent MidA family methyltransferase